MGLFNRIAKRYREWRRRQGPDLILQDLGVNTVCCNLLLSKGRFECESTASLVVLSIHPAHTLYRVRVEKIE